MNCPRCREAIEGDQVAQCSRCNGSWIPDSVVEGRIAEVQGRKRAKLDWMHDKRDALPCAMCGQLMETQLLFEVPVDRCRTHGVWFDSLELERVLNAAGRRGGGHGRTILDAVLDLFWLT